MDRTELDGRVACDLRSSDAVDGPATHAQAPDVVVPAPILRGDLGSDDALTRSVAAEPAIHGPSPNRGLPAPTSFDGLSTLATQRTCAVDNGPAVVAATPTCPLPARTNTETVGLTGSDNRVPQADEGRARFRASPDKDVPAPKKRAARKAAINPQAPIEATQPKRGSRMTTIKLTASTHHMAEVKDTTVSRGKRRSKPARVHPQLPPKIVYQQATDGARATASAPTDIAPPSAVGGPAKNASIARADRRLAPTRDPARSDAGATNQGGDMAAADPSPIVAMPDPALAPIVLEIREQHRQRQDLMRAETSLTLQIRAKCRRLCGGDKDEAGVIYKAMMGKGEHPLSDLALAANRPFLECRDVLTENKKAVEKRLDVLAKQLPVAAWVDGVRGIGIASLAALIGETGDLSTYANPAKVWKRMGLAVIDGGRQRRIAGDAAIEHGFSPTRRAIMWNIGASMLRASGTYRPVYDARKAYELARGIPAGQAHARAKRYMEKRIVVHVWRAWNGMTVPEVAPYVAPELEAAA